MVTGALFPGLNRKGRDADQRLGLGTAIILLHCYANVVCYREKFTFALQATVVLVLYCTPKPAVYEEQKVLALQ
jgi:hypothetical protein